jgi:hypothetical protein
MIFVNADPIAYEATQTAYVYNRLISEGLPVDPLLTPEKSGLLANIFGHY